MSGRRITTGLVALLLAPGAGAQILLTNGTGNGSIIVRVDGYGSWGSNNGPTQDLLYDDLGGAAPSGTTYQSAVLFHSPTTGARWLTQAAGWEGTPLSASNSNPSAWTIGGFGLTCLQTLCGVDPDGSTLRQEYTVTNNSGSPQDVHLIRFADTDIWTTFSNDSAGASANAAVQPNDHWVFAYDVATGETCDTRKPLFAISAEGRDHAGSPVYPCGWEVQPYNLLRPALFANQCTSLTRTINGDINRDLMVCLPSEAPFDVTMAIGTRFTAVPAGGTIAWTTRTRLIERSPRQGRDAALRARAGQVNSIPTPISPVLHVNGSAGPCVTVSPGSPINLSMAVSPAGPNPAHYALYALVGTPAHGALCGGPGAMDLAEWSIIGTTVMMGTGAFNLGWIFPFTGSGGCSPGTGFLALSSIPGFAPLTGVAAAGSPPGGAVFPPFTLPFSVTLQGVIQDNGSGTGTLLSVTNAVEIASGGCACRP